MDCKEAEKLIQPYVQGNMPEKEMEPFISHIRKCHTCHEELETYFIVNRAMAYFEDDAPDSYNLTGLLERDLEKKEEEARYRRYKDTFFRVLMLILVLFSEPGFLRRTGSVQCRRTAHERRIWIPEYSV